MSELTDDRLHFIVAHWHDDQWLHLAGPAKLDSLNRVLSGWIERFPSARIVTAPLRAAASTSTEGAGVKLAGHRNITTDTIEELRSKWRQNPAMPAYQRLVFDGICDLALLSLNPPASKVTTP